MALEKEEITRLKQERKFRELVKYLESFSMEELDWEDRLNLLRGTNNSDDFSDERLNFAKELVVQVVKNPDIDQIEVVSEILTTFYRRGEYEDSIEYVDKGIQKVSKLKISDLIEKDRITIADFYSNVGIVYTGLSRQEEALDFYNQRLEILQDVEDERHHTITYGNMGYIYNSMGRFKDSLKMQIQALNLCQKLNQKTGEAIWLNNIGSTYTTLGELDQAEKFLKDSSIISIELGMDKLRSNTFANLGRVYRKRGDFKKGLDFFEESTGLLVKNPDPTMLIPNFFFMLLTSLDLENRADALKYLDKIDEQLERTNLPNMVDFRDVGSAIIKKQSSRFKQKSEAEQALRSFLHKEGFTHPALKLRAFLEYATLLLEQLDVTKREFEELDAEEENIIEDLQNIVLHLKTFGIKEESIETIIQVNIIEAYLELINLNSDRALELLTQASEYGAFSGINNVIVEAPEIEGEEPVIQTAHESFSVEFHESINKIIHSIPRLKIILVLNHYSKLTFRELQDKVGLTPGHLGKQCDKLTEAGYIVKRKDIIDTKFVTTYEITPEGVQEFRKYASIIKPYLLVN